MADALNSFFAKVGGEREEFDCPESTIDRWTPSISIGVVKAELGRIKVNKSTNSEDYPSWVSKQFAEFICEPLTDIFNCMFEKNNYPSVWKKAEIVPIPKTRSPTQCKEYRPISLLFHCGKIAERFFANEYKKNVLPKIDNHQFAYQPNRKSVPLTPLFTHLNGGQRL